MPSTRLGRLGLEQLSELVSAHARSVDDLVERALRKIASVHRHYDPVRVVGCRKTWWLPLTRSSSQPQRSRARTAFRGVTEGSRGVTPRR